MGLDLVVEKKGSYEYGNSRDSKHDSIAHISDENIQSIIVFALDVGKKSLDSYERDHRTEGILHENITIHIKKTSLLLS
jgi:hypothetical protein